jgi:uncharacterized membrane protein
MTHSKSTARLALLISRTLRIGILFAVAFGLIGAALYLTGGAGGSIRFHHFPGANTSFGSPALTLQTAFSFRHVNSVERGVALAETGLFCLMLTPFLRVLFAFFSFLKTRDWLFVGIAAIVLISLTWSMCLR